MDNFSTVSNTGTGGKFKGVQALSNPAVWLCKTAEYLVPWCVQWDLQPLLPSSCCSFWLMACQECPHLPWGGRLAFDMGHPLRRPESDYENEHLRHWDPLGCGSALSLKFFNSVQRKILIYIDWHCAKRLVHVGLPSDWQQHYVVSATIQNRLYQSSSDTHPLCKRYAQCIQTIATTSNPRWWLG